MAARRWVKPKKKLFLNDSEAYKEIIERSADLPEEIEELDAARTAEEQIKLYQEANERIIREGRA